MAVSDCCLKGFEWNGTPAGKTIPFPTASNQAYTTGSNPNRAIMLIHDLLGWTFTNTRLLADHFAQEADATVYVPDFFDGETLPTDRLLEMTLLNMSVMKELNVPAFMAKNSREIREPEIFACARHLRSQFKHVGAAGYCYGGWACFRLGAKENEGLVDCIVTGHPSLLTKEDIDGGDVPVQMLAPEHDPVFPPEMREYFFRTMLEKQKVRFDYQHFPGVEHACFTRGDTLSAENREAMERGKNAAVVWFREFLREKEQS